jgi:hypothetical protein
LHGIAIAYQIPLIVYAGVALDSFVGNELLAEQ